MAEPDDRYAEAEIIWDDEVQEPSETDQAAALPRPEPSRPASEPRARRTSGEPGKAPGAPSPAEAKVPNERKTARRQAERTLVPEEAIGNRQPRASVTPQAMPARRSPVPLPLLILAGVLLLVVGTVALRSWRSYKRELPQVALLGYTEGIPALKQGQFDKAYQLLSAAKEAVVTLHDQVEHAGEIREAADQASIFVNLLSDSLESLLDEAARTTPQAWASRFDDLYKGRSVIIDATITATPESSPKNRHEIDYVVLAPGEGNPKERRATIDLTGVDAISNAHPNKGDHVTFGACLESFQFDVESGEWRIRMAPKTSVTITSREALEALGWPSDFGLPEQGGSGGEAQ
jgi:hypothetical protein